jgi:hypothetical protein
MIVVANAISVAISISSSRSRIRSSINVPPPHRAFVMPGPDPGIHVLLSLDKKGVDGRVVLREDALRAFARP